MGSVSPVSLLETLKSRIGSLMKTIFLALLGFSSILAEEFTATETFTIDDGGNTKDATCDVVIFYTGSVVDWSSSTVDCTCKCSSLATKEALASLARDLIMWRRLI